MGRIYKVVSRAFLIFGALPSLAQADNLWSITAPYPENPLKVASLEGKGQVGRVAFPVMLELSCHPDATVPRAVLRVPDSAAGWNFSLYDGIESGVGQRRRTLSVLGSNRRLLDQPRFSGIKGDRDSYLLSWRPNEALLAHLGRQGDGVLLRLSGPRRSLGLLEARFVFPADATTMIAALAPCSKVIKIQGKATHAK